MPLIISVSMIVVAILSVINCHAGVTLSHVIPPRIAEIAGYVVTFILGMEVFSVVVM